MAYVYLIAEEPFEGEILQDWVKIGYSQNPPEWRMNANLKRGNPRYINAPTESWFNSFKNERVHGMTYATHADMKAASFEYIEVFYNRQRQHSTLGYRSPLQFLDDWRSKQHQEKQVV